MANQEHLELLQQGSNVWNKWRWQHPEVDIDLSGAFLCGAFLSDANLSEAILSRADLSGSDLSHAHPGWTIFGNLDLRTNHEGIGNNRSYRPLNHRYGHYHAFGRRHSRSVLARKQASPIPSSPMPVPWRRTLSNTIRASLAIRAKTRSLPSGYTPIYKVRASVAGMPPKDMKTGDKIRHRIDESIRLYDKLLLVLSKHSIGSQWVEHEVETALAKEQKVKRTVLFPIRLDTTIMDMEQDGWPSEVRHTRHITDFTHWKQHDDYQKSLTRLLRDLQPETTPKQVR